MLSSTKPPSDNVFSGPPSSEVDKELLLFDQALASTSCGFTLADACQPDLPLVYVNPTFIASTGYSADEVLGRNCRFLQGEDRDQPAVGEIQRILREKRSGEVVLRNYRKDGELFWNELNLSPIYTKGLLTHYVGIQTDVSAREQARQERRVLIGELERSQHELEQYARRVAERVGGPFAELRRLCEGLRNEKITQSNPSLRPLLDTLAGTTSDLERIAKRLLEYTAMHSTPTGFERIEIRRMVEEIVASLDTAGSFEVAFPPSTSFIFSHRERLRQIFLPLIENAVHHRNDGEGKIAIGCQESGAVMRFWVSDDGPGIPSDRQKRVFDLFETSDPNHGLGMGLSLARKAAESLGGRLWVGSVPGHGAIFLFDLPR